MWSVLAHVISMCFMSISLEAVIVCNLGKAPKYHSRGPATADRYQQISSALFTLSSSRSFTVEIVVDINGQLVEAIA